MSKSASKATPNRRDAVAPARLASFEILQRVESGSYASVLLALREEELTPRDRALCHQLVMGVLRFQLWLDRLIEHFSGRSSARIDLPVKLVLRLGLYQLRFLTRIPQSAAVNESVNLVRLARLRSADSFVNAVLRRATREPEYDPAQEIADPIEQLAVSTSHPRWLVERWMKAFGATETEAFARANNQPAPIAFRVVHPENADDILKQLQDNGATLEPSRIATGAWRIDDGGELIRQLADSGQIYFQDEASQLVALLVAPQPGDRILDVCGAPGSKATQLASMTHTGLIAGDIHLHRLTTVKHAAKTQALSNVSPLVLDGESHLPFREASFERVLVDAPCSGTGTLRHNPEIRWRISAEDIQDLSNRQRNLLNNASRVVKTGGRLIYSTCSVEPEENEEVVTAFLKHHSEFELERTTAPDALQTPLGAARTWPHRDDTDGFFVAAFARKR